MNKVLIAAALASAWMYAPTIAPTPAGGQGVICAAKNGALRLSASSSCNGDETTLNITIGPRAAADSPAANSEIADVLINIGDRLSAFKKDMDAKLAAFGKRLDAFDTKIKALETEDADRSSLVQKALFAALDDLKKKVAQGEDDLTTATKAIYEDINVLSAKIDTRQQAEAKVLATTRVQAPFEVVTKSGKLMFLVTENQMDNGAPMVISPGSAGTYSLRAYNNGMGTVALGTSAEGTGLVQVNDAETGAIALDGRLHAVQVFDTFHNVKAIMRSDDKGGLVGVVDSATLIAYMSRSSAGGGSLTAALDDGANYFSVETTGGGAGKACVNRQTSGGSIRGDCLGQGLPAVGVGR